jgi:hypothetical protein
MTRREAPALSPCRLFDEDSTVSPMASPVARKRVAAAEEEYDDEDDDKKPAVPIRRSQRARTANVFFDPGNGEPDSRWVDPRAGPTSIVLQPKTHDQNSSSPLTMDETPMDGDKTVVMLDGDETVMTSNDGDELPIVTLHKARMIEKLCATTFQFLDEKLWKSKIKEHVRSVLVNMAILDAQVLDTLYETKAMTKEVFDSMQAAKEAVSECINTKALEEKLAQVIWESFVVQHVKARVLNDVMNNSMNDVDLQGDETDDDGSGEQE